jgi:heme-degrading monooxygenase HmoA
MAGADDIDGRVVYARDVALPGLRQHDGFAGMTVAADRRGGGLVVHTVWAREQDVRAGTAAAPQWDNAMTEVFELVVAATAADPPAPGCAVRDRDVQVRPDSADGNVAFFASDVVPRMESAAGFRGVRFLLDRGTGRGSIRVVWSDEAALRAGNAALEQGRQEASATRGVAFGETYVRELLLSAE